MAYQVLARKWRPKRFSELVGQDHVVRALSNALSSNRLHHAYLFTGTRGVGKTTIARILAKGLNCDAGVTAEPCGTCTACLDVDAGRFVDLIEVDAASRAGVDDTRDLMDNVLYAPAQGRYKVYLIDEVHMFSKHSFNALLKTLEEPPEHVKFLLATTDPQKLLVTVLSRCLQFHLRPLPDAQIASHLEMILSVEGVEAESSGLMALARAARGSMRDALSLVDQAIAYGGGEVSAEHVHQMLGSADRGSVWELLEALADGDGNRLLAGVDALAESALDFDAVMGELLNALQALAVAQTVPDAPIAEQDEPWISRLRDRVAAEDVQLYYQIGVLGRRDLPFAATPRSGFDMTVLRMLAFRPVTVVGPDSGRIEGASAESEARETGRGAHASGPKVALPQSPSAQTTAGGETVARQETPPGSPRSSGFGLVSQPGEPQPVGSVIADVDRAPIVAARTLSSDLPRTEALPDLASPPSASDDTDSFDAKPAGSPNNERTPAFVEIPSQPPLSLSPDTWSDVLASLQVGGLTRELGANCQLVDASEEQALLRLSEAHSQLNSPRARAALSEALNIYAGHPLQLTIETGVRTGESPAERRSREAQERRAEATETIRRDPQVAAICDMFGAVVDPDAVVPADEPGAA